MTDKANNVHELAEDIGKKLAAAETLGAEGNVEESIRLMEEVEISLSSSVSLSLSLSSRWRTLGSRRWRQSRSTGTPCRPAPTSSRSSGCAR